MAYRRQDLPRDNVIDTPADFNAVDTTKEAIEGNTHR